MTRLYNELRQGVDGEWDRFQLGAIRKLVAQLALAEVFELSPDVVSAAHQVSHSKLSSVLAALNLARAPHAVTWFEFAQTGGRIGCLVECADASGLRGFATWAWRVPENSHLLVSPFALEFDHAAGVRVTAGALTQRRHEPYDEWRQALARAGLPVAYSLSQTAAADAHAELGALGLSERDLETEIAAYQTLAQHEAMAWSPYAAEYVLQYATWTQEHEGNAEVEKLLAVWAARMEGHPPFLRAVLALFNSRNCITRTPEDLSKLNRRRVQRGKLPLREFVVTRLDLSRVQRNALKAAGVAHADMRQHLVRGHFKIRRSGVFWWAAHVRGHGRPVPRERYEVVLGTAS